MPERGDDLEARVSRLEGEVARLKDGVSVSRADAAAARVLAGGADREVSDVRTELRAHTQVLNALRETQIEQGRHLSQLDAKVDRIDTKVDRLDAKVVRLDAKVVQMDAKVDQMDAKVDQALGLLSTGMAQIVALLSDPRDEERGRG